MLPGVWKNVPIKLKFVVFFVVVVGQLMVSNGQPVLITRRAERIFGEDKNNFVVSKIF